MQELAGLVPTLVEVVSKLGVVGLLLVAMYFLVKELLRVRKELAGVYKKRDGWRLAYTICRGACDQANIKVDLSQLNDLLEEEKLS